ncbi:endopeptidase La, partial [Candidatus Babeliales bacterium]|nr:endopeptidase La [Candidatus Babeliales bacterium]
IVFLTAQKTGETVRPQLADLFEYGTRAVILQMKKDSDGTMKLLVEGVTRAKMAAPGESTTYLDAFIQDVESKEVENLAERKALSRRLFLEFKQYISFNDRISKDALTPLKSVSDLETLVDSVAVHVQLDFKEKQHLLEMFDLKERTIHLCALIQNEIEVFKAEKSVRKRVQSQIEKHQRDYYLNEQIRAIQRELGREDLGQELAALREKAKKLKLPTETREKVLSECRRLEQMPPSSPESAVSRNYVDWLLSVPWHKQTKDRVSLPAAEKILDSTHSGMKKAKERIVEFLAAKKYAGDKLERAPIICLVGPPGVGKTSLAASIAQALGRTFVRISLGGVRDEAEIRGHRRTYIGAMPGKIIQAMKKAKVVNPLVLLDEVDKMSSDLRGDPSAALLEVLDSEQNKGFVDNFIEVEYDLSKALFVTTANIMEHIPAPLYDRMEIVSLSGYTQEEKLEIATKHLMPKLLKQYDLKTSQVQCPKEIIEKIISEYSREAGVRQLERILAKLLRKSIQVLIGAKPPKKVVISEKMLEKWLGAAHFKPQLFATKAICGVATGLAWTEVGGDALEVEVTFFKGKGALTVTGQLGEVMQESAQAALSYVRSKAKEMGVKTDFYTNSDIHIHIPEGAIPKDGPSAGITIAAAITSVLTKISVRDRVAMTGEVTLRGRVLPVGGLREKLLAAGRLGIEKVIVPKDNDNDIKEFASELGDKLKIVYADNMDTVLNEVLVTSPFAKKKTAKKTTTKKKAKK